MKKILFALSLFAAINSFAGKTTGPNIGNAIPLTYMAPEHNIKPPFGRTPVHAPSASIDGYTLYLWDECDFTLSIKEENGEVAYSTFVPATQTAVILPADLSGTYTIEVTRGEITFIGEIEL